MDYVRALLRFWRSAVAVVVLAVTVGVVLLATLPKSYTAEVRVFLTVVVGNSGSDLSSGTTYSQNQVDSFAEVTRTPIVLNPVIRQLGLTTTTEALANKIGVSIPEGTSIMAIRVTDADPAAAADIANSVGASLVDAVEDLAPTSNEGKELVRATVIAVATTPSTPSFPPRRRLLLLTLAAGLVLGLGQAALRFTLDKRIHDEEALADLTDAPIMGRIALDETTDGGRGTITTRGAEDYRRLRTNLQFIGQPEKGKGQAFVISSPLPGEGKTTVALNLATVLAQAGESVLLIDADLRRPQIAKRLGLEGAVGLTTLLIGRAVQADTLQSTGQKNLTVMAAGSIPPNPSELLASAAMLQILEAAKNVFRYIIIDSSPLLPVTDAAILSRQTDGALVIVNAKKTTAPQLAAALESIDAAHGKTIGLVVNKIRRSRSGYGSKYDYYYRYDYGAPDSSTPRRIRRRQALPKPAAKPSPTSASASSAS
jgi:capsular exopolysaccharide synthesis family protein